MRTDRGAAAPLITIALGLLLLGMAALAIDIGAGFNERRLDQNGADVSVLGGALEEGLGGTLQDAVNEITTLVDINVRPGADWLGACFDPDPLPLLASGQAVTPATDCISWNAGFTEVRVRVPRQDVDTTFGIFLGVDALATSAAANARIQTQGIANSPPFVVLDTTPAGEEICLRTNVPPSSATPLPPPIAGPLDSSDDPVADPCDESVYNPASQFFGTLNPFSYLDPVTGDISCSNNEVSYSIARGIDHLLSQFDPDFQVGVDDPFGTNVLEDYCNNGGGGTVQPLPNTMQLETGLDAQELRCGMLTTGSGVCGSDVPGPMGAPDVPARMQLGSFFQSQHQFLTEGTDNKPLWDFFVDLSILNVPTQCRSVQNNTSNPLWNYYDLRDELLECLSSWNPNVHDELFDKDILDTPRYMVLPYLAESDLVNEPSGCPSSGATRCVHFNQFVPVYLQSFYSLFTGGQNRFDCDPGGSSARWGIHPAGFLGDCGRNNDNLNRISGIVLHCDMFPDTMWQCPPGNPNDPSGTPVPVIELVK